MEVFEPSAFVGRVTELARLSAAYERVAHGGSAVTLVGGEAGIGKSRLVDQALMPIRLSGATILVGACLELGEAAVPYAPIAEAIRGLVRRAEPGGIASLLGTARAELARLLPELSERPGQTDDAPELVARARLFEAVVRLLDRLAAVAPVVLVVEDLQWADGSTRDLVRYVIRGIRHSRVLIIGTFRTDALGGEHPLIEWVAELVRDGAERLELQGLDRGELRALVTAMLGIEVASALVDRIHERTDGNPFFAEALLDDVARGGGTRSTDTETVVQRLEGPLPPRLRDVLAARVADLDEATAEVVRAAAAAGPRIDDRVLAAVVGQPITDVGRALRQAVELGVLVGIDGPEGVVGHAFRHTLVREVVRAELGPGEREELHATFARVLETTERPAAAELAYHWDAAGDARRALPALVQAARTAERAYAFDETRRHARRALELWSRIDQPELLVPVDRIGLLDRCAFASALLGDYEAAVRDAREAVAAADAGGDPHRAALLHDRLRWILWESGDRRAALAEVEVALERLTDETERAKALAHLAGMRMFAGQLTEARAAAEESLVLARANDTRGDEAIALAVLGWVRALGGEVEAGLTDFRTAIAIAEELESVEGLGLGHTNLVALLDRIGRPSDALAAARDGLVVVRRLGMERSYGGQLRGSAAKALFALGRWDEADALTDEGLRLEPAGPPAIWLHVQRARIDAARGRFADADRQLDAARRIDDALGGTEYRSTLLAAAAERAVWDGRADDAREAATEGLALMVEDAVPDPGLAWLAALALRSEADAAERARLRRDDAAVAAAIGRARTIAARLPGPDHPPDAAWGDRGRAILALCGAELARLDGQDGADPIAWADAAQAWEAVERPFPAAYCRFRQAEAILATRGDRETARAALADAQSTARRLGAAPLLAEVELLARHARLDPGASVPADAPPAIVGRPVPATGAESLDALGFTPRELEVLRLVAGGWTNQQIADTLFITRKTASVHVSNILAKLGVAGRGEAGAIAHRLGLGKDAPPPPGSDPLA